MNIWFDSTSTKRIVEKMETQTEASKKFSSLQRKRRACDLKVDIMSRIG